MTVFGDGQPMGSGLKKGYRDDGISGVAGIAPQRGWRMMWGC